MGTYLRARRAATPPDLTAQHASGFRRVPGLRREEVAVLAGLSVDYYIRLEQGREIHPSAQVIDALSRALNLNDDARGHVYRLAGHTPPAALTMPSRAVGQELTGLLETWEATPAYIIDRTMDILAENELARALHSGFSESDNLARMTFLDPAGLDFYVDWERAAHSAVGYLRLATGHDSRNPRLLALIAELTAHSAAFRTLWDQQKTRGKTRESKQFRHPDVGVLILNYTAFEVSGNPGQQLIVHFAAPHTRDAEVLALLGSLTAPARHRLTGGGEPRYGFPPV